MSKFKYFIICLAIILQSCNGQKSESQEIYNKDFNWRITIPENFENVSAKDWSKLQNKGTDAFEKTTGEEVVNNAKTIFVFKSDQLNYFESNYQPFDMNKDGDYLKSCKNVNNVLYETFKNQIPGAKIEGNASTEKIDGLVFQTYNVKIEYPNKMVMHMLMFSRLFGKREFSVNIMYVDELKGQRMLDAWKSSKFRK